MFASRKIDPDQTLIQSPDASSQHDPSDRSISVREFNEWVSGANLANREFRRSVEAKSERQRIWILTLCGCLVAELVVTVVIALAVWR